MEDPRQEWRAVQEAMLRDYLQTAQDVLEVSLTYDSHAYDCNRPQGDPSSYLCFFFFSGPQSVMPFYCPLKIPNAEYQLPVLSTSYLHERTQPERERKKRNQVLFLASPVTLRYRKFGRYAKL